MKKLSWEEASSIAGDFAELLGEMVMLEPKGVEREILRTSLRV